ncbi:MAG: PEP-CTERM sorting domain-containing protein [Phycisphaerales bacterium]|jgi:hypothetical protein|nr:PEP-CTERM sorting domain-containing protein [Phycisphaerales bacterium]
MARSTPFRVAARAGLVVIAASTPALANPVDGVYFDLPDCDDHGNRVALEELGNAPLFPTDELIESVATFTQQSACPPMDNPAIPNALVVMTNLTGRSWTDLFYVGDLETTFTNVDGVASTNEAPPPNSLLTFAFRIDSFGLNRALVFESIAFDGVFEPGETWHFIIQDYSNTFGLSPAAFGSLDFAGGSVGDGLSSGSIVQFIVPAPGSLALLGAGALASTRRRR